MKRFGPRYGRTVKHKLSKIEAELKKKHRCPYCHSLSAKRVAAGIWYCKKCNAKFTGKAYSIAKKITVKEKPEEEIGIEEIINKENIQQIIEEPAIVKITEYTDRIIEENFNENIIPEIVKIQKDFKTISSLNAEMQNNIDDQIIKTQNQFQHNLRRLTNNTNQS